MKYDNQFTGNLGFLCCEVVTNLKSWKLPRSKHWPKSTLSSLENFFIKSLKEYSTSYDANKGLSWSFSIILVGKLKMKRLNREYRKKDYVTDVLSFPAIDWKSMKKLSTKKISLMLQEANYSLGDIVICKESLIKQAREYNLSIMDEYIHLLVHGFLHLLGYDHEISKNEAKIMEIHEKYILDRISRSGAR